jgi:hypothetical protein
MKTIAQEIQELRAMPVADLVERYEALHGKPPRVKHREHLWRRCAWKVQEQRFGGLSTVAKRRLDELIAELDLPLGKSEVVHRDVQAAKPLVGTTLTRTWKGREVTATSVDGGWQCDGVVYRSLSAVARAVTGSRWNGKLFFGLTERRARS